MIAVTSFSREGYEKYGKNLLESVHNFPCKVVVYTEEHLGIANKQVKERDLNNVEGFTEFLSALDKMGDRVKGVTQHGYNYNFDLHKFCRKMFAQFDAFKGGGQVFWLDGDTEIVRPITKEYLSEMFDGEPLVLFGREGFYCETGFVGFDTEHKDFEGIKQRYIDTLKKGQVFSFKGWHDCYCLDYAREGKGKDLTKGWKPGDPLHVIPKSNLGQYLIHRKGNRKDEI